MLTVFVILASCASSERWALIVTGSRTYENYRHHADVAHAYQRLRAGGVDEDHIISMQFGDVPFDPSNPYQGQLFNKPSGDKPGRNVNAGFTRTFSNTSVTKDTFLSALLCTGSSPCVASSSPDASLFIFWAGHGSDKVLLLPDGGEPSGLQADELVDGLRHARKGSGRSMGFAQIAVVVAACDSGSMFDGLLTSADTGIYAISAALPDENSYPTYCCNFFRPPSCTVGGEDIGSCLGDLFAVSVWEDADLSSSDTESLDDVFAHAKAKTAPQGGNPGSTVSRFGDVSGLGAVKLTAFIGATSTTTTAPTGQAIRGGLRSPVPACAAGIGAKLPWIDCIATVHPLYSPLPTVSVNFTTADARALSLFRHAETCEAANTQELAPGFEVLVEGGHYRSIWLETQPMGGASYGVRNLRLALNNQLAFMRTQRDDGRLAGMITKKRSSRAADTPGVVHPTYSYPGNASHSMLQGFYMASPAVDVAWLMNRTNGTHGTQNRTDGTHGAQQSPSAVALYLDELESVLSSFDTWLWSTRNSSHGVLWLNDTADTGEDGSDRLRNLPPSPQVSAPFESMDMMGYAYDAQRALARIALIRGDPMAHRHWETRMASTAASLKKRLWHEALGACFDRQRDGDDAAFVTTLVHNNLRVMWSGAFDQSMADTFIARHLMNKSEFWTPTPLVSIAASDPRFRNQKGNNWSGPPEGLTFQRAIRALERYGHHAEVIMAGTAQKRALLRTNTFPQQIDPFSSVPDSGDCYGPMVLALLEYTALTTGIAVRPESASILWSSVATDDTSGTSGTAPAFSFTQQLGSEVFVITSQKNGSFTGHRNGALVFECSGNTRVVTDTDGVVTAVVGVSAKTQRVRLQLAADTGPMTLTVAPNEEWAIADPPSGADPVLSRKVPFNLPFGARLE